METYRLELTQDGSPTFHSSLFGEACHARQGALRESRLKFAQPAHRHLAEASPLGPIRVLDACYGLGYNSFSFLDSPEIRGRPVEVLGIEIEAQLLARNQVMEPVFPSWTEGLARIRAGGIAQREHHSVQVLIGGLEVLYREPEGPLGRAIGRGFDLIFHDAFTARKCPELWCVELFTRYRDLLREGGAVLTYSSAHPVSAGFIEAGFSVRETPAVDRRQGGILAVKDGGGNTEGWMKAIHEESTAGAPYRAKNGEPWTSSPPEVRSRILEGWESEKAERVARGKETVKRWLKRADSREDGRHRGHRSW
ncbi:MAG: hypothetical protein J0L75_00695 [Spirochaetes bacterium]|nr:hypothetical protein [Spirochaetota bacterium]